MKQAISKLRVRNFKAVIDSGSVRLTPLTVFIGNNGSGKSSMVEALGLFKRLAAEDVVEALGEWPASPDAGNRKRQLFTDKLLQAAIDRLGWFTPKTA